MSKYIKVYEQEHSTPEMVSIDELFELFKQRMLEQTDPPAPQEEQADIE